jgi:hypothetical protein
LADQTKNTIVSELDERLDTLFGEDVGDVDALTGSPLEGLKSLVMTIDWEISESTLGALTEELNSLRSRYSDDKPVSILLKMMTSLAGYVQKRKGSSHPDSIQLFHVVAKDLARIVEDPDLDPKTRNAIVKKDIDLFQDLKSEISDGQKKDKVSPPPEAQAAVEEDIPVFEPVAESTTTAPDLAPEPSVPPEAAEQEPPLEGTIEYKEDFEPAAETVVMEAEEAAPPVDLTPSFKEQVLETAEEEPIPEYEMEGLPEFGAAQEISESTSEDLKELDDIFQEELSRTDEPLEEPGFEPIPSPEELGIGADVSMDVPMEDVEPLILTDSEDMPEVFEVSEEPTEDIDSLFTEQADVSLSEVLEEDVEAEPVALDLGTAEAALTGEAFRMDSESLNPILEAIQSLGRELHDELDGLRSEVNETKKKLNELLERPTELHSPEAFEADSGEPFDLDFEAGGDAEGRLFSETGPGEDVPKETEKQLGFEEASLEDIFEDTETGGGQGEPGEETKTLQELFEEAVAPTTEEAEEVMDFEFEGDEDTEPVPPEEDDDTEEKTETEGARPSFEIDLTSEFVAVTLSGREYVLPAEYVVKTGKIKDKTRAKILKSGSATMDDLKGPFQSLKKDVFPAWEHLSQKELRQLSFPVVVTDAEESEEQQKGRGIVLLKSGDRCGTLIADEEPIRVGAEDVEDFESLDVDRLLLSTQSS